MEEECEKIVESNLECIPDSDLIFQCDASEEERCNEALDLRGENQASLNPDDDIFGIDV